MDAPHLSSCSTVVLFMVVDPSSIAAACPAAGKQARHSFSFAATSPSSRRTPSIGVSSLTAGAQASALSLRTRATTASAARPSRDAPRFVFISNNSVPFQSQDDGTGRFTWSAKEIRNRSKNR